MGPRTDQPLMFIEGLSAQLIGWREPFCQAFVDLGYWVIRLDNRDVGLSEKFGGPTDFDGGYEMEDMAGDALGVLDTLDLSSVHVVGQSMGGMVAQTMAIGAPERVRSMTLFYTAPSSGPYAGDDLTAHVSRQRETNPHGPRDRIIEEMVESQRFCASTAYPFDEAWIRELAGLRYDRCHCPDGPLRQYAAAARAPDRLAALCELETPTAIIHGRADRLIKLEAALDMAKALDNSELHVFPGLGHEIARPLWEEFTGIIDRTAKRASSPNDLSISKDACDHPMTEPRDHQPVALGLAAGRGDLDPRGGSPSSRPVRGSARPASGRGMRNVSPAPSMTALPAYVRRSYRCGRCWYARAAATASSPMTTRGSTSPNGSPPAASPPSCSSIGSTRTPCSTPPTSRARTPPSFLSSDRRRSRRTGSAPSIRPAGAPSPTACRR